MQIGAVRQRFGSLSCEDGGYAWQILQCCQECRMVFHWIHARDHGKDRGLVGNAEFCANPLPCLVIRFE